MSVENEKYQEIDRGKVIKMGGTLYIKVPKTIERQDKIKHGDTMIYSKSADSKKTTIHKLEDEKDV